MRAVYIAHNTVPRPLYGVIVGEPISYVVLVQIERIAPLSKLKKLRVLT